MNNTCDEFYCILLAYSWTLQEESHVVLSGVISGIVDLFSSSRNATKSSL